MLLSNLQLRNLVLSLRMSYISDRYEGLFITTTSLPLSNLETIIDLSCFKF